MSDYEHLRAILAWPNPFLPPIREPRPRQYPTPFPMGPTTAAIWAIVQARMDELWPTPADLAIDFASWFGTGHGGYGLTGDPLAEVRRDLQAWLDGPSATLAAQNPPVGVATAGTAL